MTDSLLAAEIFLSGLDRNMSKQKLDLFQFTTSNVAQWNHDVAGNGVEQSRALSADRAVNTDKDYRARVRA